MLLAWLAHYFEEPGNWSGDNHYQWSNCIARKEFDAARARGMDLILSRRAAAERAAGDHRLIRFCRDHHLSPRPAGGDAASWQARCPSGSHHSIMISTASSQWGCGYCRKRGGLDDLAQWLASLGKPVNL